MKRLFLLAGFDKQNVLDETLIYYTQELSKLGDVILCLDSDLDNKSKKTISKYTIHTIIGRHEEYDFGSYKRAYIYADKQDILKNYNFVYLVNDSVYGPLFNLKPYLIQMENFKTDAFGMARSKHSNSTYIQSWFVGLTQKVFLNKWFKDFILDIQKLENGGAVAYVYERGLTKLIEQHNLKWKCIFTCPKNSIYNKPKKLFKKGLPFLKKIQ